MRTFLLLAVVLLLTGCHRPHIACRSEYLHPSYLASSRVNTPDAARACFYGQQIIVSWNLPQGCAQEDITLALHIRFGNREIETVIIPIAAHKGWWIYRLVNEEYWSRCGILAFRAELLRSGELIDSWTHYLWAEIIDLGED